jgi:glycerophosphoryl diester phosphodiesterase
LRSRLKTVHRLDIQGHRGARGLLPENTLPAFSRALELQVDTLELDCAVTADGVAVISHDAALNPDITRDEHRHWLEHTGPAIVDLTYAELQRFDVGRLKPGTAYATRFPRQQPLDGTRIPRLQDLFTLVRHSGNDRVRFNIETKISPLAPRRTVSPRAFVDVLLRTIRIARMAERVSIQSFDWRTLQIVQREAPGIPTVYLTAASVEPHNVKLGHEALQWTAGHALSAFDGSVPRMIKAAGGAAWSPYFRELDRGAVEEAQQAGLKVVPWTVNEERDMRRLIDWQVDSIISDYPDVLVRVAMERGRTRRG